MDTPISVVVGGTSGIGLATAERLATDGGRVAVIGRRQVALDTAERTVTEHGAADVLALKADATDDSQLQAAFEAISAQWGHLNALIVTIGPSGAGKSTLCKMLLKQRKNLVFSISATTRLPRPGDRRRLDRSRPADARAAG